MTVTIDTEDREQIQALWDKTWEIAAKGNLVVNALQSALRTMAKESAS